MFRHRINKRTRFLQFIWKEGNVYRFDIYLYDSKLNNSALVGYALVNKCSGRGSMTLFSSDMCPLYYSANGEYNDPQLIEEIKHQIDLLEKTYE